MILTCNSAVASLILSRFLFIGLAGNAKLVRLWRKNAVYGILETESDIETPAWSVPNLQG